MIKLDSAVCVHSNQVVTDVFIHLRKMHMQLKFLLDGNQYFKFKIIINSQSNYVPCSAMLCFQMLRDKKKINTKSALGCTIELDTHSQDSYFWVKNLASNVFAPYLHRFRNVSGHYAIKSVESQIKREKSESAPTQPQKSNLTGRHSPGIW